MVDPKLQELYDYVVDQISVATAKEQVANAQGKIESWHTGEKLAYSDAARKLINLGCRKP